MSHEEENPEEKSKVGEWIATGFFFAVGAGLFAGTVGLVRRVWMSRSEAEEEEIE